MAEDHFANSWKVESVWPVQQRWLAVRDSVDHSCQNAFAGVLGQFAVALLDVLAKDLTERRTYILALPILRQAQLQFKPRMVGCYAVDGQT